MTAEIEVDAAHGGRWHSLRSGDGHEWLWSRPDDRRWSVRPGDPFVDVGGVEECFPTITASPDHGDAWSRPWESGEDGRMTVDTGQARLSRRLAVSGESIRVDYALEATPGYGFVWAFHALITPSRELRLDVADGERMLTWPQGPSGPARTDRWPEVCGVRDFGDLRHDDGSAVFGILPDRSGIAVAHGGHRLRLRVEAKDQPTAIGLWRNLGGFSWDDSVPYRSFGVEPMLGRHPRRASAPADDLARVPADGRLGWSVRIDLERDRLEQVTTSGGRFADERVAELPREA